MYPAALSEPAPAASAVPVGNVVVPESVTAAPLMVAVIRLLAANPLPFTVMVEPFKSPVMGVTTIFGRTVKVALAESAGAENVMVTVLVPATVPVGIAN